ncbi:hypothetical protein EOA27_06060 [Mesorhizobium sp. M2A.F.Ca.ET.037.01.1.1]|uniref:hypothetical protein n=1 Tax=unclassified Mesorhizobium TaxID=325217 RepID=UPI000FCB34EF|nr:MULTISPECIES: hypothetical protein [unclassified Mesorhizobium]RUX21438.1 hypothetical protein EOA27_06060 [Mesorhizobium sp. M2A.F.Ca.ET.037.01.1.1]RUY12194.1 hypothetical protein EOA25_03950 [Mesorhizobium sp. M2A.F.Ca.ET.040.01.1.1]RWA90962.1 MAG: hypothetical protein EOQ31_12235 [Mesorhizobium sp.]TIV19803.1 MAG: hypothetical protein E5V95_07175 [Mesorhizobium sp.]
MFADKTLLILGAGASFEIGLPVGDTLKEQISAALKVELVSGGTIMRFADSVIDDAAEFVAIHNKVGITKIKLLEACRQISAALPLARSIDNYLNAHKDSKTIELCGKLGIARCILQAERNSWIKADQPPPNRMNFGVLKPTWYNRFANLLFEVPYGEFLGRLSNLSVITFNYDRCFEHFMYHAIQTHYGVDEKRAAEVVNGMSIYHPYGKVGNLPWMGKEPMSDFGEEVGGDRLVQLAGGEIKTYTEGVDRSSSEIQAIHRAVRQARTVVFLGFGFIPLNMSLLKPDADESMHKENATKKTYYATALNMSDEDTSHVRDAVRGLCPAGVVQEFIRSVRCVDLFGVYGFSLGLS